MKSCQNCIKVDVCKMYETATVLKQEFNERFSEQVVLAIDVKELALSCKSYTSPIRPDKANVKSVEQYLLKELAEAKKMQNEGKQIEIQKLIRDLYDIPQKEVTV